MRKDGQVKTPAVYGMVGVDITGKKDCLGLWIAESESSKYWLSVLNELKNRGVKDILICAVDGLTGFKEAIKAVFPETEFQSCIVHQIRNSLKYVSYKHGKEITNDLKLLYRAATEESALQELEKFEANG